MARAQNIDPTDARLNSIQAKREKSVYTGDTITSICVEGTALNLEPEQMDESKIALVI